MADETTPDDEPTPDAQDPPEADGGEPGREEVAGARDGQPGYDLDEGAAYEERQKDD